MRKKRIKIRGLKQQGFSLLETLLALAVLSLVLSMIIQSLHILLRGQEKTKAAFEASLLLDEISLREKSRKLLTWKDNETAAIASKNLRESFSIATGSRLLASGQTIDLKTISYYQSENKIQWRQGREFLILKFVLREKAA